MTNKQSITRSWLNFSHVMKTIAYVTVTLNKNIIERHELIHCLFGDIIADRKQWVCMTISNYNI